MAQGPLVLWNALLSVGIAPERSWDLLMWLVGFSEAEGDAAEVFEMLADPFDRPVACSGVEVG